MNAAVAYEPDQMHSGPSFGSRAHRCVQCFVFIELTGPNGMVDPHSVARNGPAGTEI
jgi:hypothetical protein